MIRILAYILTAVLTLCFIFQLAVKGGSVFPPSWAVADLVAIGIIWAVVLLKRMPIVFKAALLVVFSLILFSAPIISGLAPSWADRPRNEATATLGGGAAAGSMDSIAIVYHPGGTDLTRKTVLRLGENLAARGYGVSLFTANPKLSFEVGAYRALILGSPVYGGETRPPLKEFVAAHAPLSIPVFALLTGSVPTEREKDLDRLAELVGRAGGSFRGGAKVVSNDDAEAVERELTALADAVERSLKQ